MMKSAIVLFSGGQDSSTCLAWALSTYDYVETVGFDYGQRHAVELKARECVREQGIKKFAGWALSLGPDHMLDLKSFGALADSALTQDREIEMTERGLPSTFVPGRNLVFLTYAAALADRRGITDLITGVCETDYSGYPDCRRATIDHLQGALQLGMERDFKIITPLMRLTKAQTWAFAHDLGGDDLVELIRTESHTCYRGDHEHLHDWGYGCGACPACEIRAKGYEEWQNPAKAA